MQEKNIHKKIIWNSIILILVFGIIFISFFNIKKIADKNDCKEFKENVLWSSEYSNDENNLTKYQTWYPKYNCTALNVSNCFIDNLELKTRFIYLGWNNEKTKGFIQISNPDKTICETPEKGIYEKYLAYETLTGESFETINYYCGKNANFDKKCGVKKSDNYSGNICYGIKMYTERSLLVDIFEIKYELCETKGGQYKK